MPVTRVMCYDMPVTRDIYYHIRVTRVMCYGIVGHQEPRACPMINRYLCTLIKVTKGLY